jgi:hypothetical protein
MIKGFIYLKSVLLEKCKFSYFLPRSSNQDALEIVIWITSPENDILRV